MKIIQSFSEFEEGSPYVGNMGNVHINFYSFLLSCLTLKKYYGKVTMYCNEKAYDSFIRFIPYSHVEIMENKNSFNYWNMYKLDAIKDVKGDVVHVDPDVFIFDSLFDKFVHGMADGIVQDTLTVEKNKQMFVGHFVDDNQQRLIDFNIFDSKKYDGRCYSCGVLGVREGVKERYFNMVNLLKSNIERGALYSRYTYVNAICEELGFYLTSLKHNLKVHEILPHNYVMKFGQAKTANMMKYTHLWSRSKFKKENVDKIKEKIKKEFPNDYHLVDIFEKYLRNNNIPLMFIA